MCDCEPNQRSRKERCSALRNCTPVRDRHWQSCTRHKQDTQAKQRQEDFVGRSTTCKTFTGSLKMACQQSSEGKPIATKKTQQIIVMP